MKIKVLKEAEKTRKPQNYCPWYTIEDAEPEPGKK